jgi:hypothetical protein
VRCAAADAEYFLGSPPEEAFLSLVFRAMPAAERMEVLRREATREGAVVIYSAIGLDRAKVWLDPFTKELLVYIDSERARAGQHEKQ